MEKYIPSVIEPKWQKKWEESGVYKTPDSSDKPKYYILDMFPYASGAGLHVGHPKGYIATDVVARMKSMQGHSVLHPMGWDSFGLPAENYALQHKVHPRIAMEENVARFKQQLRILGFTYDWSREVNTADPAFYRWTQWIFLQLFKHGLAYESTAPINWCPSCQTGLANEDLEDGKCERCGSTIEKKPMRQWVLKITAYAERLLNDLELLPGWEASIKEMQRNWIGKSEGIEISYPITREDASVTVFTTRPETNFGATFVAVAPESAFVGEYLNQFPEKEAVAQYISDVASKSDLDRQRTTEKTGVFTGWYALNPLTALDMPVYVADFVLGSVGTGALVGVPAHDLRDFEFAQAFGLEVTRVVVGADGDTSPITRAEQVQEENGVMVNSDFLNGMDIHTATTAMMDYMEEQKMGKRTTTYRIQDWVFSRQRYWGDPIPLVHCGACGVVAVPEDQLPVTLPEVEHYEPTGTGESPLAAIHEWVNTSCPQCGGPAKRETNTMPQWAGSSWYWLRYCDPQNEHVFVDPEKEKYWSPVDQYVGGAEHAARHLIYARFWHKFLFDQGLVSRSEPFERLQHVGLIQGEDGRKMSKRFGNVVNPDDVVARYGADALRLYEMFMGPFDHSIAWSTQGVVGVRKFLDRVWNLQQKVGESGISRTTLSLLHKTIHGVGTDSEQFKFNTAVSKLMILVNAMGDEPSVSRDEFGVLIKLLYPFAPHIAEELWERQGGEFSLYTQPWPTYDEALLVADTFEIGVMVNGKLRGTLTIAADSLEDTIKAAALALPHVQTYTEGKEITHVRYVPGRVVSITVQ